jgi:hypothetical protein
VKQVSSGHKMWHEARKHKRATQKSFSDYKKRAEKRREEERVYPSSLLQRLRNFHLSIGLLVTAILQ